MTIAMECLGTFLWKEFQRMWTHRLNRRHVCGRVSVYACEWVNERVSESQNENAK